MGSKEKIRGNGDRAVRDRITDCTINAIKISSLLKIDLTYVKGFCASGDNAKREMLDRLANISDTLEAFAIPSIENLITDLEEIADQAREFEDRLNGAGKDKMAG